MPAGFAILVLFAIGLAIVFRMAAGGLDRERVRQYVESRGGQFIDARWAPFGPGWFGDKSDRIYEVRFIDRDGNEHLAHCKTSLFTGVYFTEDQIVTAGSGASQDSEAALVEENQRLREEVERLKRGAG